MATSMAHGLQLEGVRERARIHDSKTSSRGAGRQQRVLLDHRLFASNPTLPGASASDPVGHLLVSIRLALVPSFEMKLRKNSEYGNFFPNISKKFRISIEIPGSALKSPSGS